MSIIEILLAIWLIFGFSMRDILQKYSAHSYRHDYEAGALPSVFMIIGIFFSLFFLHDLILPIDLNKSLDFLTKNEITNLVLYYALPIGILKGFIVFFFNSKARNLDTSAVSGATYLGFVSLSIGSTLNYFLFNENIKILPIIGLSLSALLFYLLGPGRKILKDKKAAQLIKAILLLSFLIPIDYIGIRASNWYIHLIISNTTSFIFFLFLLKQKKTITNINFLKNPYILASGIFYVLMEFSFVFSFSVLGVSYAFLFGMLSYLPTMLYGSIRYQEGSWYTQTLFCLIAIFFIYIIAFVE